jgi:hypothetical protein
LNELSNKASPDVITDGNERGNRVLGACPLGDRAIFAVATPICAFTVPISVRAKGADVADA